MIKRLSASLLILSILLAAQAQSAPSHLIYFGYYIVDCLVPDRAAGGPKNTFTDEVAWHTNLNQMAVYNHTDNLVARINAMNGLTQKPFLSLEQIFWYDDGTLTSQGVPHYSLHPDYQARWDTFRTINASVLNGAQIGCFYLVDEPVWHGIPFAQLNAVSQLVKAAYPRIPQLYVEAYPVLGSMQIPVTVDWVGFDQYYVFNPATNPAYLANLATLKAKRSNNQRIFIIADTNWVPDYLISYGKSTYDMGPMLQSYYDLAASEPDVIGILGYVWPGGFGAIGNLGVRNMPQSVLDLNLALGRQIKVNGMAFPVLANGSFEYPTVSGFQYNPSGAGWIFAGGSAIQANGSAWGAVNAPAGSQTAVLQGSSAALIQSIGLPAGSYTVRFKAARRSGQIQPVRVSINGQQVGSLVTPASNSFADYATASFTVAAGYHTLRLEGTDGSGDKSTFIDQITLSN